MHILSVICLLLLIPYVVIALAFMPKGKGRQLFNMIYSSVALGGVGALIFFFCRQYVTAYAGYPDVQAQQLDTMVCCLLLMIPVTLLLIILNMVLKKPKGGLLFFIAMGLSVADGVGVCLYAFFLENIYATFLPMAVPAAVLLVPLFCALAAGGQGAEEGHQQYGRGNGHGQEGGVDILQKEGVEADAHPVGHRKAHGDKEEQAAFGLF